MLVQGVGQCVNQATGPEDSINKPYRPIPQGRVSVEEAFGLAWLLALFAVGRAFTVNITFGLMILNLLFFALFYNLKPIYAKRYCWVNLLWMATSRGLLPFLAVWSAFGNPLTLKPWLLGSIAFFWVFAFQSTKDVLDVKGDKIYGITTLPVKYGQVNVAMTMVTLSTFPFIALFMYLTAGFLPDSYVILLTLGLPAFCILGNLWKTTEYAENTKAWVMFYIGLASIYLLSFIAELV